MRIEFEAAGVFGRYYHRDFAVGRTASTDLDTSTAPASQKTKLAQFGYAFEFKYGFFNDTFHLGFDHGLASGSNHPSYGTDLTSPFGQSQGLDGSRSDVGETFSTFRFNPSYAFDLLLYREILGTAANTVYFKPWLAYSMLDNNVSARLDILYAMAQNKAGAPRAKYGQPKRGYGLEFDLSLRYHDQQEPVFFQAQYGLLVPFDGIRLLPQTGNKRKMIQTLQAQVGIRF